MSNSSQEMMTAAGLHSAAFERCAAWVQANWGKALAPYAQGQKPNPLATCFAVCGLECVGRMDGLHEGIRDRAAAELQGSQDPETGLFSPGVLKREDLTGRAVGHNATYMRMQMTYFALHALDALGSEPLHDIALAGRLCSK